MLINDLALLIINCNLLFFSIMYDLDSRGRWLLSHSVYFNFKKLFRRNKLVKPVFNILRVRIGLSKNFFIRQKP